MRKTATAVVCIIIVISVALPPFVSAAWSMFRSDPARSGVGTDNSADNPVLTPTLLWKTNITWNLTEWDLTEADVRFKENSWTPPAVVDGVVYAGLDSMVTLARYGIQEVQRIDVYAFNATNGAEIWRYGDNSCDRITPPAVVNGVVYFATDRYTCALNASDGSLLWKYSAGMFISYPAVADGMVFIGSGEGSKGTLLALNATDGRSIWNFTNYANSRTFSSPAIANGIVYVGSFDENIYALDSVTGDKLWDYHAGDFHSGPAVAKGVVYAMTSDANIYALNAINGVKIWNYSIYDGYVGRIGPPFAIMNGILYADNIHDELYAFNAVSGAKIWNHTFGYSISAPAIVKGTVYVSSKNALYALNAINGEILWNYTMGVELGEPVVVNGVAYIGSGRVIDSDEGQVYAIGVPPALSSSELPQTEPFPTVLVAIASIGLVAGISAGLLVYFKKRKKL